MCMIMNMNIYITKANEELLKKEKSMSGLINKLLSTHYGARTVDSVHVSEKDESIPTADAEVLSNRQKTAKLCRHNSDPSLCKFRKPGKKCK